MGAPVGGSGCGLDIFDPEVLVVSLILFSTSDFKISVRLNMTSKFVIVSTSTNILKVQN